MVLLAALVASLGALRQVRPPPVANRFLVVAWRGPDSRDRHWLLETSLEKTLEKEGFFETVPSEEARAASRRLDLPLSSESFVDLTRLAYEVRAEGIVVIQVWGDWVEKGRASVELRAVVYDTDSGFPVNGAKERAKAGGRDDAAARGDAFQQAATKVARTLRRHPVPKGRVVATSPLRIRIDQGSREGFRVGDRVFFRRGGVAVGLGSVRAVRANDAEAMSTSDNVGIALGDTALRIYDVPFEPPYRSY